MIFRRKHDVTDIYGVKSKKSSVFSRPDEDEAPESGFRYSGHYHKFFRGYTEIRRLNSRGGVTVERYYTRPWISSGLSDGNYLLVRLVYALLTAASAALFIAALTRRIPANVSFAVAIPGYAAVIPLFLLAASVLKYIFLPRKMTLWEHYSGSKRLKIIALVAAGLEALTALALALFAVFTRDNVRETLFCAAITLLSALCSAALFFIERRIPYRELPNETALPEGEAHEIW